MRRALAVILGSALLGSPALSFAAPTFRGLGELAGGNGTSNAFGVSADGSVVVGSANSGSAEAFVWTETSGMVGIGGSRAEGVSADGQVVVGDNNGTAFRWPGLDGLEELPNSSGATSANDASANGSVVVGSGAGAQAFVWTESAGAVALGDLSGTQSSRALGVSNDGAAVVGIADSPSGAQAFRWTTLDGMVGLGGLVDSPDPFGFLSISFDISGDGSTIVGSSASTSVTTPGAGEAFVWTEQTGMLALGDLPGGDFRSQALSVSFDGSLVVGVSNVVDELGGNRAFIWDQTNGMRDLAAVLEDDFSLDLTGWTLFSANAISDDGLTIVGAGRNPSGVSEAWIASVPEPQPWWLASLVLVSLCARGSPGLGRRTSHRRSTWPI